MALPVTITDFVFPDFNYFLGPFKVGSNYYVIGFRDSGAVVRVECWKATDPTSSWTRQDTFGITVGSTGVYSVPVWAVVDYNNDIAVAWETTTSVEMATFDTGTDSWGTKTTVDATADNPTIPSASVGSRASDLVILYNGDQDREMGTFYDRVDAAYGTDGGTWTVGINVPEQSATQKNWRGAVIVEGLSNRMHCFYKDVSGAIAKHATFKTDNTFDGTAPTVDSSIKAIDHVWAPGIAYVDGGATKVRCPYMDDDEQMNLVEFDSADAPTYTVNDAVSDNDAEDLNGSPVACAVADGTDVYLLYIGGGASGVDKDFYYDKNDGTDTEEADAVTYNRISANVYDRSGTKIGYVYDDNGTSKYNEIDIGAVPTTAVQDVIGATGVVPFAR